MDSLTRQVISWLNENVVDDFQKEIHGNLVDLPNGFLQDPHSCPIAIATGLEVNPDYIVLDDDELVEFPDFVKRWINDFDEGYYPKYDASLNMQEYVDYDNL